MFPCLLVHRKYACNGKKIIFKLKDYNLNSHCTENNTKTCADPEEEKVEIKQKQRKQHTQLVVCTTMLILVHVIKHTVV